ARATTSWSRRSPSTPAPRRCRPPARGRCSVTSTPRPSACPPTPRGRRPADGGRAALTPATKAVIAVDLFGNVAPVDDIEALGVPVLEDAAQAVGSSLDGRRAGALGRAGTVSFFPSKNLGGFGDGGAIAT